jgi:hypothetical protein
LSRKVVLRRACPQISAITAATAKAAIASHGQEVNVNSKLMGLPFSGPLMVMLGVVQG